MFSLPPLPYSLDALEPHMSKETLEYHHGKHVATYVEKLNGLLSGHELEGASLTEIIQKSTGPVFNNAAQISNHELFFGQFSKEDETGSPRAPLLAAIEEFFGGVDAMQTAFNESAIANFGSGWTWLCTDASGKLSVINTDDADTPIRQGALTPLVACDVWEHAYYIDYRNARPEYLKHFWHILNWAVVSDRYEKAVKS